MLKESFVYMDKTYHRVTRPTAKKAFCDGLCILLYPSDLDYHFSSRIKPFIIRHHFNDKLLDTYLSPEDDFDLSIKCYLDSIHHLTFSNFKTVKFYIVK